MKYIIGKKLFMSQLFSEKGKLLPVTIIQAGPCFITQIKTHERDGYNSIQIGFCETKETRLTKPQRGHLKPTQKLLAHLKEFKDTGTGKKIGDEITVNIFNKGDKVYIHGISKGKGFQGVVKRHGFHGSPATHGHKDQERMPGSIGATNPQRTVKGRRMGGHMGDATVTVKNLDIVDVKVILALFSSAVLFPERQ